MIDILAEIDAPDNGDRKGFNCGIVLREDRVIEAADIVKYMRGWSRDRVRDYCASRGWRVSVISQTVSGDRL